VFNILFFRLVFVLLGILFLRIYLCFCFLGLVLILLVLVLVCCLDFGVLLLFGMFLLPRCLSGKGICSLLGRLFLRVVFLELVSLLIRVLGVRRM